MALLVGDGAHDRMALPGGLSALCDAAGMGQQAGLCLCVCFFADFKMYLFAVIKHNSFFFFLVFLENPET